jgi:hypothetical protein
MNLPSVVLPGPVAVIPSSKAMERLGRDLPDPVTLVAQMTELSRQHGLPARIDQDKREPSLAVYTSRCVAWLRLTRGGDAYRIAGAAPKGLKDHERLVAGAMLIQSAAGWWPLQDVAEVSRQPGVRFDSYWPLLVKTWHSVRHSAAAGPHEDHLPYLDLLTEVVEATRDIEVAKQRAADPALYRRCGPTREQRFNAKGVYDFTMVASPRFAAKAMVYVADQPEMRGRVVAVRGNVVTVRFESTVDYQRIPPQGGLRQLPGDRVYRAQLEAIDILRRGRSANPHLLRVLVDNTFVPYRLDERAIPREPLDQQQLAAFRRALAVPDLSLIWGPPGTGKTRTITAIAAACAAQGKRVLVTSHTNRAVDNVLKQLPGEVRSVRVGNEDAMTSHARGLRADVQVEALQQQIMTATEGAASRLAAVAANADADRWLTYLTDNLTAAQTADGESRVHAAARNAAAERAMEPLRPRIDAAQDAVNRLNAGMAAMERRVSGRKRQLDWISTRAHSGMRAALFGWLARPLRSRVDRVEQSLAASQASLVRAQAELDTALDTARALVAEDPAVSCGETALAAAQASRNHALGRVDQASQALKAIISPVAEPPHDQPTSLQEWEHLANRLRSAAGAARRRASVLAEWRACVPRVGEEFQRELVRYADVVAATCIGAATTELLAELDFDIAIVDEAGQISLPNLLVPLVRAKRAVLVGDHAQLPPFLDDDVKRWGNSLARARDVPTATGAEVVDLLAMSAFERLYDRVPADHKDMLRVQRRMPKELADFVSRTFYRDALDTEHPGAGADPIFRSSFAMINTADRPPRERAEARSGRRREDWNQRGYVNEFEATLITQLIIRYVRWYPDWTVIVPYRAQADLLRRRIAARLGDGPHVTERVGTVDSFQGGERSLIVYGFTRSNSPGDIGFLKELRRINVAISRAQSQLVLVGDTHCLEHANDHVFASVMRSMTAYLRHNGDLRGSREVEAAMRGMEARA